MRLGLAIACLFGVGAAQASMITLTGSITQDTQDGGSPAVLNASLNNIMDGDSFTITLNFTGTIASPGTFAITSLVFDDPSIGAQESAFISGTMVVSTSGAYAQFSLLGCLIDDASCASGNQLALEFQIPKTMLTSAAAVTVQLIPALLPMDLLEDGGSTDIQGTFSHYSYARPVASAPEPSGLAMLALGSVSLLLAFRKRGILLKCSAVN